MVKPLNILLVEDDIDDIDLLKDALIENNIKYTMQVIMEGDKVYRHLQSCEILPDILVMDLNLPKIDGKQILQEIKSLNFFTHIPIIVLTTSSSKEDINYCNGMGVSKFITKPSTINGWDTAIHTIISVTQSFRKVAVG